MKHIISNFVALQVIAKLSTWLVENPSRISEEMEIREAMLARYQQAGEVPEVADALAQA